MGYLSDLLALVTSVVRDIPRPSVSEGIAVSGSWNAQNATVQHIHGDTGAILGDEDDDQPLIVDGYSVLTTAHGDQYAPRGEERTVAVPMPSGMGVLFVHGPDTSPQAPAGERWINHYNATGQVDSFLKHTNDGHTPGDGLGGAHYGGNANQTQFTTKMGHTVIADDTAKTVKVISAGGHVVTCDDNTATKGITVQTAGGLQHHLDDTVQKITHQASSVKTILDGAGNTISQVATTVGVGDLVSNLSGTNNAAMRFTDLSTFESSLLTKRLDDLSKLCAAMVSAGVPNAGSVFALIASLVHVPVPPGSANVLIK